MKLAVMRRFMNRGSDKHRRVCRDAFRMDDRDMIVSAVIIVPVFGGTKHIDGDCAAGEHKDVVPDKIGYAFIRFSGSDERQRSGDPVRTF